MRCPKCGFVSYPGLPQCKKCGHRFILAAPKPRTSILGLLSAEPATPAPGASISLADLSRSHEPPAATPPALAAPAEPEVSLHYEPPPQEEGQHEEAVTPPVLPAPEVLTAAAAAVEPAPPLESPPAWREELAERVENFRRRRARLQRGADEDVNLDLDFESARTTSGEPATEQATTPLGRGSAELEPAVSAPPGALDSFTLETATKGGEAGRVPHFDVALGEHSAAERPAPAWDLFSTDDRQRPPLSAEAEAAAPVEIVLEPDESRHEARHAAAEAAHIHPASVGWRFLAAIVDGFILLVAAALFGVTLWLAGARLSPHPLNLAVLGFIALFLFLSYFGWFTALTATTPGLCCVGIRVCNVDGVPPTWRESWWRAFGYLVSAAALLLGFLWAVLDSEGLTWHDRMSGTFLVRADNR